MFRQLIQSKQMDDSDVTDQPEDPRLEDTWEQQEEDLQIAAVDRYQRLAKQLLSLEDLLDNGKKENETLRDYITSIVMDGWTNAHTSYGVDTSSEESPLFQELAKSPLFQQLEKIQSILKEYFSGPTTPHESEGLRKHMNKSPCTTSTTKWDFACTREGGISPEYVEKYIKRVFKFYHFLDKKFYRTWE